MAAELGYSETVFVDDAATGAIRIFTPGAELAFAGHPTVGTGWLLRDLGLGGSVLRCPAGDVATWQDGDLSWIRARPEWIHPITRAQLASPAAVDALTGPPPGEGSYYPWAWIDEAAGTLRARYFVPDYGIGEDEATGAAAVMMGGLLGRPLEIHQGIGSVLHVRPGPDGTVEVGGRVEAIGTREVDAGMSDAVDPAIRTASPSPAAFHYGPAHMIMHGNPAFLATFGRTSIGMPAREAMTELPRAAFELMDRVYREGRPLARRLALPAGEHRLVVVPRMDPETGETYGVTTHLRLQDPPAPPAEEPAL